MWSECFNFICKTVGVQYLLYGKNRLIIIDFDREIPVGMMIFRVDLAENKVLADVDVDASNLELVLAPTQLEENIFMGGLKMVFAGICCVLIILIMGAA